jgi:hypothetical protein
VAVCLVKVSAYPDVAVFCKKLLFEDSGIPESLKWASRACEAISEFPSKVMLYFQLSSEVRSTTSQPRKSFSIKSATLPVSASKPRVAGLN